MKNDRHESGQGAGLRTRLLVPALLVALTTGCGDVFQATNPGRILEEDLKNRESLENLVTGMSSDYSAVFDELAFAQARASDEMAGSGSYTQTNLFAQGIIEPEEVNFEWEGSMRARFNALNGIELIQEVLGDEAQGNPLFSRAHLFAAKTNLMIAENFCQVVFDGGEPQPKSAGFQAAIEWADQGLTHAQAAGETEHELAMKGVKAMANVGLENWSEAASLASQIPTDFEHMAIYSDNSGRERSVWWVETHNRFETSAWKAFTDRAGHGNAADLQNANTQGEYTGGTRVPEDPRIHNDGNPDPRIQFTNCIDENCPATNSADGVTPMLRQEKFPDPGSDIPSVDGEEMRLIEAEAALNAGDFEAAIDFMNEVRAQYDGLNPIPDAVADGCSATSFTLDDPCWAQLDYERGVTLWLQGKRLWDLHRWQHPWLRGGTIIHDGQPIRHSALPISRSEALSNENIGEAQSCSSVS